MRYLFLVSLAYGFPIMRPVQDEIRRRGGRAAWFFDESSLQEQLLEGEECMRSVEEVMEFNPIAVITCSNHMYHFFPGVKVQLFHGYPLNKRATAVDTHFTVRGLFDIYCTQGDSSTPKYRELERKYRTFKVYQTGWSKSDLYFPLSEKPREANRRPVILYSSTFTKKISSTLLVDGFIEEMLKTKDWEWVFMFHPKLTDRVVLDRYEELARRYPNASFAPSSFDMDSMQRADVMLCDSSAIILEFMFLDKPVVTFRNTQPGEHLLDVESVEELLPALQIALSRPEDLMQRIRSFTFEHEPHRDGECSARVLDAIDSFIKYDYKDVKPKPLNLLRRYKMHKRLGYYPPLGHMRRFLGL